MEAIGVIFRIQKPFGKNAIKKPDKKSGNGGSIGK
jgi:hypothetical protein